MTFKHGEITKTVDAEGKEHYVLHVDPAVYGAELGKEKAAPAVTPKRPPFSELVAELNKKGDV